MTELPIQIPDGFTAQVKVGDKVEVGQVLAYKKGKSSSVHVNLAVGLSVSPQKVRQTLKKQLGDLIEEGEVLAEKSGVLGSRKITSNIKGTIFSLEEDTGILTIKTGEGEEDQTIASPVEGTITLCDNGKIVIKSNKNAALAKVASGEIAQGEVLLFTKDLKPEDIDAKISGKIIAAKSFDRESLAKAMALGAKGIITQNIKEEDLENLKDKKVTTPVLVFDEKEFDRFVQNGDNVTIDASNKSLFKL